MKYAITILIFVAFGLGGYWYGYRVGFEEATILNAADSALDDISAIDELKHNPDVSAQDLHELQINKSLISYGEYMDNASPPIPGFYSVRPALERLFSNVVSYRKENPRVRDGIEYSPSNKEYEKTEEYKQLPHELRQRSEKENLYYKNAMEEK